MATVTIRQTGEASFEILRDGTRVIGTGGPDVRSLGKRPHGLVFLVAAPIETSI